MVHLPASSPVEMAAAAVVHHARQHYHSQRVFADASSWSGADAWIITEGIANCASLRHFHQPVGACSARARAKRAEKPWRRILLLVRDLPRGWTGGIKKLSEQ
jgi:hypothetical protein